jgi:membrane-bound metal-dependent hydrolase YbcI (DUF457 family)
MMGYSHALSGLAAGCAVLTAVDYAATALGAPDLIPLVPAIVFAAVVGGAALLPDIDHHNSSAARALGPITNSIARGVDSLSLIIYHATRTPKDPGDRDGGHRLITHTPVGSTVFGLLAAVACAVSPWGSAVTCALVIGLLGAGSKQTVGRFLRGFLKVRLGAALVLAIAGGVSGYLVSQWYPGWWALCGLGVLLGCLIHREGDWCTNSGVPRRLWPKLKDGRRWDKSKAPATFDTGEYVELKVVRPLLGFGFLVTAGTASGILQLLVSTAFPILFPGGS